MFLARDDNYANVSTRLLFCPYHHRHQQSRQQCVAEVIEAKMNLVALFRRPRCNPHCSRVQHKDIQALLPRSNIRCALMDALEQCEVQVEISKLRWHGGYLDILRFGDLPVSLTSNAMEELLLGALFAR